MTDDNITGISVTITITLCLCLLINSILFTWEATRRSADDVVKINISKPAKLELSDSAKIKSCIDSGGMPNYDGGDFMDCRRK